MLADVRGWTLMGMCYLMRSFKEGNSNFSALSFWQSQGGCISGVADTFPSSSLRLSISSGRVKRTIDVDTIKLIKPSAQFQCSHATAIAAIITPIEEQISAMACKNALLRLMSPWQQECKQKALTELMLKPTIAVISMGNPAISGVGDCKRPMDSTAIHRAIATKLILLINAAIVPGRSSGRSTVQL